jgi:hypothetical protein
MGMRKIIFPTNSGCLSSITADRVIEMTPLAAPVLLIILRITRFYY